METSVLRFGFGREETMPDTVLPLGGNGIVGREYTGVNDTLYITCIACTDVNKYRMWKYGDSFCWLFFNARFGLGAIGGVIGEVLNQISLTVGIIRYRKKDEEIAESDENN